MSAAAPPYYPLMLDLRGRLAVVVGGGAIAEQKLRELRAAGARVRVVAPRVTTGIEKLALAGEVALLRREYARGDLHGARIAIAATGDAAVNRTVWEEAEHENVLLNAVDDVARCHFIAPSVHRCGDVTVTVSTAGTCPTLAVRLRERIARMVRREHAELARLAGSLRAEVARRVPELSRRRALWYRIVDSAALAQLRDGRPRAAAGTIEALVRDAERDADAASSGGTRRAGRAGSVALVGAGPGDRGLITVRGRDLLEQADVVVHDQLVGDELLDLVCPTATLVAVGKHGHGASVSQERINDLLVREARLGRRVVRLKGGDPFVFGRGAEECEVLRRAGIVVEVVPGVTSAIAAPAAAGIPLTHRALASGFAVVTGHECEASLERGDADHSNLDWRALARIPTLVVLMGLRALPAIAERLIAAGASPDTPAAVIARATLPDQRAIAGTLGTLAALVAEAELPQPATIVIGEVVKLHGILAPSQARADAA